MLQENSLGQFLKSLIVALMCYVYLVLLIGFGG